MGWLYCVGWVVCLFVVLLVLLEVLLYLVDDVVFAFVLWYCLWLTDLDSVIVEI